NGTNELTMCVVVEMVVLTALFNIGDPQMRLSWALLAAAALISSAIAMFAPGIWHRVSRGKHDFWFSASSSIAQGLAYLVKWLLHSPILLLAVLFVPLAA